MLTNLKKFIHSTGGAIAISWGISLPVVVGSIGVGVEIGLWYGHKREQQVAADAGAHAGAWVLAIDGETDPNDEVDPSAKAETARMGFDDVEDDVTILVNHPPASGSFSGNENYVEVIVRQQYQPYFARLFLGNITVPISARAVGQSIGGAATGPFCILSTAPDGIGLRVSGNSNVGVKCGMASLSSDPASFGVDGGSATIDATDICVLGGADYNRNAEAQIFLDAVPEDNCNAPSDPLAGIPTPEPDNCNCEADDGMGGLIDTTGGTIVSAPGGPNAATTTLYPGTYCDGLDINTPVDFQPGIYYIFGGGIDATNSQAHLTSSNGGVMFVNLDNCGDGNYGNININGGTATLSGLDSSYGDYAGVLFWNKKEDPQNTSDIEIVGNAGINIDGMIYWNNVGGEVEYGGTPDQNFNCAAAIIGYTVWLHGDPGVVNAGASCASGGGFGGFGNSSGITVRLVE